MKGAELLCVYKKVGKNLKKKRHQLPKEGILGLTVPNVFGTPNNRLLLIQRKESYVIPCYQSPVKWASNKGNTISDKQ